jgi:hypothetical protein
MNNVRLPITVGFNPLRVIGYAEIDTKLLPDSPDFVLSLSYRERSRPQRQQIGEPAYIPLELSVLADSEYATYLSEKDRA